jgi:hypothetical protein
MFYRGERYSLLVVDGLSRSYTTLDRQMYMANGVLDDMWRHWMPGSFAVSSLAVFLFQIKFGHVFLAPRC